MRRRLSASLLALMSILLGAIPVLAVVYGVPDGHDHPYVGLFAFFDPAEGRFFRCSGTLLSPTIFLTAGHCTFGAERARVYFDPVVGDETGFPEEGGVQGEPFTHPAFSTDPLHRRDVGVVVLDEPVILPTYGALSALGVLDDLATRRGPEYPTFTVVGYGFQYGAQGAKPVFLTDRVRIRGTVRLVTEQSALTDGFNLQVSSNPGHSSGGICFGDSGGPLFLGDTNVLVAVSSFLSGNLLCKGDGFANRLDIAEVQEFIAACILAVTECPTPAARDR